MQTRSGSQLLVRVFPFSFPSFTAPNACGLADIVRKEKAPVAGWLFYQI